MRCCSAGSIFALDGGATVNVRDRNIPVQFFSAGGFGTGDDPGIVFTNLNRVYSNSCLCIHKKNVYKFISF